jgi:hypothetical protein
MDITKHEVRLQRTRQPFVLLVTKDASGYCQHVTALGTCEHRPRDCRAFDMLSFVHRMFLLLVLGLSAAGPSRLYGEDSTADVVSAVTHSIEHNQERLSTFRATVSVSVDLTRMAQYEGPAPTAKTNSTHATIDKPNERPLTVIRPLKVVPAGPVARNQALTTSTASWTEEMATDGQHFRWQKEGSHGIMNVWLLTAQSCQQYVPAAKSLLVTDPGRLPSTRPVDPRNYGLPDSAMSLLSLLKTEKPLSASYAANPDRPIATVVYPGTGRRATDTLEYRFDSAVSFLPTRMEEKQQRDGRLHTVIEVEYQKLGNGAFFPQWMLQKQIHPRHLGGDARGEPDGIMTFRVIRVDLSPVFDKDFFTLAVPADAVVRDIRNRPAASAVLPPTAHSSGRTRSPVWYLLWTNVGCLVALTGWLGLKWYNRSPKNR